jgi:hypothetical protein
MALMKPSPLVQTISGNTGSVNFRAVAGRTVVAASRSSRRTQTAAQCLGPDFVRRSRALWDAATDPERLAWTMVAKSRPVRDRFWNAHYQTGLQAWTHYLTKWWLANDQAWLWSTIEGPFPEVYIPDPLTSITAAFDSATGIYTITPDPLDTVIQYMLCWAVRFARGTAVPSRNWRFIGSRQTTGGAVVWQGEFQRPAVGWTLCQGESVWLAVQTLKLDSGSFPGQMVYLKTTVT